MSEFSADQVRAILAKAREVKHDPTRFVDYADDPVGFARDVLGIVRQPNQPAELFPDECGLWTKQQEFVKAFVGAYRVCCKSGHGTGKSFSLAIVVLWWHLARKGRVISTGPTKTHIQDVLWPEIHEIHRRSLVPLPGQLDRLDYKQDNYWYATGVTTDQPGAFAGRHHPDLLILLDEGASILDMIHTEADTCANGERNCLGMVGNPINTSGKFYSAFKDPETWRLLTISCLDHPNVVSGKEIIPGAVTRKWVEAKRKEWGETHPFWFSRVLGQFPSFSEKGVVPLAWLERSQNQAERAKALAAAESQRLPRVAGFDVARYGQNKCVFILRRGDAVEHIESWSHLDTMQTTGKLIQLHRTWGFGAMVVDASGLGVGVVDRLFEQQLPFKLVAHNGGHRAGRPGSYSNRRSEGWFHLRNRMEKLRLWLPKSGYGMLGDDTDHLVADLLAPEYEVKSSGRIQVETKEKLMDRGVASPDWADALVMSFLDEPDPDAELDKPAWSPGKDPEPMLYTDPDSLSDYSQLPVGF